MGPKRPVMLFRWINKLVGRTSESAKEKTHRRRSRWQRYRIVFEELEDRRLLAAAVVDRLTGVEPRAGSLVGYVPPEHNLFQPGGYLTEPSTDKPLDIAVGYLATHAAEFGISPADV